MRDHNIPESNTARQLKLLWLLLFLVRQNEQSKRFGLKTTISTEHNKHSMKWHKSHYKQTTNCISSPGISLTTYSHPLAQPGVYAFLGGL